MWESRWTSWAVRPNEPSGFRGRKELLNRASALVTTCPKYVNWHLRILSINSSWFGKLVWPIKSSLTSSRCRCKVGKILRPTTTFTLEWHNDIDTDMALKRRGSFFRTLKNVEPDFDDVYLDRGASAAASNKWLFEIAWEVANKGKQCEN